MEDAFLALAENKIVKFKCSPEGPHQCEEVSKGHRKCLKKNEAEIGTSDLIGTVAENRKACASHQFLERSKEARKLHHIVDAPTVENFKSLLHMNVIKNCPVAAEGAKIAEKTFRPDMSSLKGKPARRKPMPVRKDLIKIPKELMTQHHNKIELCTNTMHVNECRMLTAIVWTIKHQSLVPTTRPDL